MTAAIRLALFSVGLLVIFAAAFVLGGAVGPFGDDSGNEHHIERVR